MLDLSKMQNFVSMSFILMTAAAHLVVLKLPSDHSECVVYEVVVYVNLQLLLLV